MPANKAFEMLLLCDYSALFVFSNGMKNDPVCDEVEKKLNVETGQSHLASSSLTT
jgi:hypothetical protein